MMRQGGAARSGLLAISAESCSSCAVRHAFSMMFSSSASSRSPHEFRSEDTAAGASASRPPGRVSNSRRHMIRREPSENTSGFSMATTTGAPSSSAHVTRSSALTVCTSLGGCRTSVNVTLLPVGRKSAGRPPAAPAAAASAAASSEGPPVACTVEGASRRRARKAS
nr:hypothetical protein HeiferVagina-S102_00025 [Bovine alphaherpesvirus 1]WHT50229.1 hypothetical protein Milk-S104_00025 [Bovine alphaherpesvirus 1]WHT50317.1 hypothetical protein Docile-S101_00025 [Bovine alphaherpesvirus 1]